MPLWFFFSRHNKQQIASVTDFIILAKSEKPRKKGLKARIGEGMSGCFHCGLLSVYVAKTSVS